jgi:acyl carrier protein
MTPSGSFDSSTSEIIAKLGEVFREVFDEPGLVIVAETGPGQITAWDSMAQVQIVVGVELAFDIVFETDDLSAFQTVGELAAIIRRLMLD